MWHPRGRQASATEWMGTDGNSERQVPRERAQRAILCDRHQANGHRRQFGATRTTRTSADGNSVRQA
eukprot:4280684-Karenia_brevis.AAC.1